MGDTFKPMLACSVKSLNEVTYPCYIQPKIDGIRCCIAENGAVTRNLKPIPNKKLRELLNQLPIGFDGELLFKNNFQATTSKVMTEEGTAEDIEYHVFDFICPDVAYKHRYSKLCIMATPRFVQIVDTIKVNSVEEVLQYEEKWLAQGYEGVILRGLDSGYKFGRSTAKQGWLLKYKQFQDAEAIVTGSVEMMHNENEKETNELGNSKRSHKALGMVPAGILGALNVKMGEIEFQIGSGFNMEQRAELWKNRTALVGKIVKFKSFLIGVKTAPRFPTFLGFRDKADM